MSSGPKTRGSYGPTSPRGQYRRSMAAPGMSLDMPDKVVKKAKGGKIKKMNAGGRALTPYEQRIAAMSPFNRKMMEKRAAQGPNPAAGAQGIAQMSPFNAQQIAKKAASSGGGGGTGVTSGGAMARGMPTSGLPDRRGKVTVEEVEDTGGMKRGGSVKGKVERYASGGMTRSSASKRADGCAVRGKTKGRFV